MKRATTVAALLLFVAAAPIPPQKNKAKPPAAPPAPAIIFGLDAPREWTYEVTFDTPKILYAPYSVSIAGMVGSSVTNGSREAASKSIEFTIRSNDGTPPKLTLDDAAQHFWFAPATCAAQFSTVSSDAIPDGHPWHYDKEAFSSKVVSLEMHLTPCDKNDDAMDWVLGEIVALAPADGRSSVSRLGWETRPATEPITVPAGTFANTFYSRFPRGDGHFAENHVVESWTAPGTGLVRYRVSANDKTLYTVALKSVKVN